MPNRDGRIVLPILDDGVGVGVDVVEDVWVVDQDRSQHNAEMPACLRNA
jgi:hypothetical protein